MCRQSLISHIPLGQGTTQPLNSHVLLMDRSMTFRTSPLFQSETTQSLRLFMGMALSWSRKSVFTKHLIYGRELQAHRSASFLRAFAPGTCVMAPRCPAIRRGGCPTLHNNWNAILETVSQHFDDIAVAVTNRMRDFDGSRIQGDVLQTSICISIEWQWRIMPVVTQVLAIAFFLLGLWQTSQARIPVWKSSSLPLLFYGPTDGAGIRLTQPAGIPQLESKADEVKMRCEDSQRSGYGFYLSETEAEPLINKNGGAVLRWNRHKAFPEHSQYQIPTRAEYTRMDGPYVRIDISVFCH
jgi:hypothetical protein